MGENRHSNRCFVPTTPLTNKQRQIRSKNTCHKRISMRAMRFRPCIDLHEGRVKQIVGGTLTNSSRSPDVNFETTESAGYFASLYQQDRLPGGHVIMLGPGNEREAIAALNAYPDGLQIGGGITPENAHKFLNEGASHVIVTSYVFQNGRIAWERVEELTRAVGKNRLVLDLSCRKRGGEYVVCTDRWTRWSDVVVNAESVGRLGDVADELLVHAVDVEGRRGGIDLELVDSLGRWAVCPITYAGGVREVADLTRARDAGGGLVDVTIGSALDIFGGALRYTDAVAWQRKEEERAR